ncbi:MAG: TraB/GumN family protein [Muribaculaceae bacterium]|nr:TraB/GumN family protein [Muribaculaceae bacterium]
MKKLIISIAAIAAASCGLHAQIFWKVSGGNATGDSYIFGTHHLAPVSMVDSVAGFRNALASVSAIAGEIDFTEMQNPAVMQAVSAHYTAPADSMLTMVLTQPQTDSLNSVLASYTGGMLNAGQIAPMKPAMVSTQLALFVAMEAMGPEAAQALASGQQLDSYIQQMAASEGKSLIGFESIDRQMTLLMDDPIAEQADALMKTVAQIMAGTAQTASRELTQAYLNQDLAEIERLILDDENFTPESHARLITDRNADWTRQLSEILPDRTVLVAVGVGHLPGAEGLIELLRKEGYTVEPVTGK